MKNMKKMKRLVALALSVVMVLAMSVVAFAADSTPVDVTKHTFDAYQIFSGEWISADSKLEKIEWGNGVNGAGLLEELKKQEEFKKCDSAAAVAEVVGKFAANSTSARKFAVTVSNFLSETPSKTNVKNEEKIDAGYYLIVDTTETSNVENNAKNLSLLSVGTTVTVKSKNSYPTVTKKVQDINDSTDGKAGELQDSADYDIGDKVPFTLTGTLPSDYASYTSYKYVFHDVQSAGLSSPEGMVVKVDDKELTEGKDYTVVTEGLQDGCTFEIVINNLKTVAPKATATSKVVVTYKSELNTSAVIGSMGNPNNVFLEYSNNPNVGGSGETGKTPKDKVIVFTYKVVVNKYKNEVKAGNELAGAEFTLSKVNANNTETVIKSYTVSKNDKGNVFTFTGLDDGTYILTETVTPSGYNTIDPITFTVKGTHSETWEDQEQNRVLTRLTGDELTGKITFTSSLTGETDGSLATDVVNKSGTQLPSTGGIGTTIFYVVGAILMVGAAVLLITKRRAEN